MSGRAYAAYCVAVCVALVGFKLWLGTHVVASAMMADDDENLNRAIYFVHGDFALTGYPFSRVPYGTLYPLVVSPSLLFGDPGVRLGTVFAINAALGALVVFVGSMIVHRLTGVASFLVPLCLAAWAPLFQMSFYALTENLLFPMLVVVGWLVVDFDGTLRTPWRLVTLAVATALLPLVRVPALAVVPGLLAVAWSRRRALGRAGVAIVGSVLAAALLYVLVYRVALSSEREGAYAEVVATLLRDPARWGLVLRLAASQLTYLFVATAYWVFPVAVVVGLQTRRAPADGLERRWRDHLLYAAVTGAGILGFALVHLTQKVSATDQGDLIYGRYDDPAGLLLTVAGLGGLLALRPLSGPQRVVLRVVAPLALCFVLPGIVAGHYVPINQAGLSLFSTGSVDLRWTLLGTVLAVSVSQLVDERRLHQYAALGLFLAFSLANDWAGMRYTIVRAKKVDYTVQGSEWLADHAPPSARVGYDGSIFAETAPGVSPRLMGDVYRIMMFRTYPRPTVIVGSTDELDRIDYLYTDVLSKTFPVNQPSARLEKVWTNGLYVLYRVAPGMSAPER